MPNRRRTAIVLIAVATLVLVFEAARRLLVDGPASVGSRSAVSRLLSGVVVSEAPPTPPENPTTDRERLLAAAFALEGTPYEWGAKGPDAYDCSGFTKAAYAAGGVELPDGSFNQADGERPLVDANELCPGDLIIYRLSGSNVNHVTLYAGSGWAIGTGSPGQPARVVCYPLNDDLVSDGRILSYRHIMLPDEARQR